MGDITKRTMEDMQQKEQPRPKKPSLTRSFGHHGASPFQPWKPSLKKGLGIVEASNNINMRTTNPNHPLKMNPFNVGGGSTSGAAGGDNGARTNEPQLGSGSNTQSDMDPQRLKRIIANRASAQRSRMRKNEYIAILEEKVKSSQDRVVSLRTQTEAEKIHQRDLQIEQHQLKFQMAVREKDRVLQEVEIEKNKAEIKKLGELLMKKIGETQARMMNMGFAMQHLHMMIPPPDFEKLNYLNPNQGQTEVGTSRLQTVTRQQPQNQRQIWMGNWNNGKKSTLDFNIVKSEPADY